MDNNTFSYSWLSSSADFLSVGSISTDSTNSRWCTVFKIHGLNLGDRTHGDRGVLKPGRPWILVSTVGLGISPLQIMRDDCYLKSSFEFLSESSYVLSLNFSHWVVKEKQIDELFTSALIILCLIFFNTQMTWIAWK